MKKESVRVILLLTYFASTCTFLTAQITIGTNLAPLAGSILDLKEYEPAVSNNTTATKEITTFNGISDKSDILFYFE